MQPYMCSIYYQSQTMGLLQSISSSLSIISYGEKMSYSKVNVGVLTEGTLECAQPVPVLISGNVIIIQHCSVQTACKVCIKDMFATSSWNTLNSPPNIWCFNPPPMLSCLQWFSYQTLKMVETKVIFFYLQKLFNSVPYPILPQKIRHLGS